MKKCIIVLGMHRSGTSVCAGVLSHFDVFLGQHLLEPNEENPKGFFENTSVLGLNKAILQLAGADWDDYHFSLDLLDRATRQKWLDKAEEVIEEQFQYSEIFLMKDPRLCLTLPIWLEALKAFNVEVKVVIPYRSPLEVAHSLAKRNQFSIEKSLLLWARYFFASEYYSRDLPRLFIHFADDFEDMSLLVERLQAFTGLDILEARKERAESFFEYRLKQQNFPISLLTEKLPDYIYKPFSVFKDKSFDKPESSTLFDECKDQYEKSVALFKLREHDDVKVELDQAIAKTEKVERVVEGQKVKAVQEIEQLKQIIEQQKAHLARLNNEVRAAKKHISNQRDLLNHYHHYLDPVIKQWSASHSLVKMTIGKLQDPMEQLSTFQGRVKAIGIDQVSKADMGDYVEQNADIKRGIGNGKISNPLKHYIQYGYDEIKSGKRKTVASIDDSLEQRNDETTSGERTNNNQE